MKRFLHISFLLVFLLGCKSNENDGVAADALATSLAGRWRLTETEVTINKQKVWQIVKPLTPIYMYLSPEAVVLDSTGKSECCQALAYNINGIDYKLDPQVLARYYNTTCNTVNCFSCVKLEIDYSGNELIMGGCQRDRVKYIRD